MLTREQADTIATAIAVVRPAWDHNRLMGILGRDDIKLRRGYIDTFHAFLAIALDLSSEPAQVLDAGPHWAIGEALARPVNTSSLLPNHADDDCRECGRPARHPSHFDESDLGCVYLSPSAWAARTPADHRAKAADVRAQMRAKDLG